MGSVLWEQAARPWAYMHGSRWLAERNRFSRLWTSSTFADGLAWGNWLGMVSKAAETIRIWRLGTVGFQLPWRHAGTGPIGGDGNPLPKRWTGRGGLMLTQRQTRRL